MAVERATSNRYDNVSHPASTTLPAVYLVSRTLLLPVLICSDPHHVIASQDPHSQPAAGRATDARGIQCHCTMTGRGPDTGSETGIDGVVVSQSTTTNPARHPSSLTDRVATCSLRPNICLHPTRCFVAASYNYQYTVYPFPSMGLIRTCLYKRFLVVSDK